MRAVRETVAAPKPGDTPGMRPAAENASGITPLVPMPASASPVANAQGSETITPNNVPNVTSSVPARRTRVPPKRSVRWSPTMRPASIPAMKIASASADALGDDAHALHSDRAPVGGRTFDDRATERGDGEEQQRQREVPRAAWLVSRRFHRCVVGDESRSNEDCCQREHRTHDGELQRERHARFDRYGRDSSWQRGRPSSTWHGAGATRTDRLGVRTRRRWHSSRCPWPRRRRRTTPARRTTTVDSAPHRASTPSNPAPPPRRRRPAGSHSVSPHARRTGSRSARPRPTRAA